MRSKEDKQRTEEENKKNQSALEIELQKFKLEQNLQKNLLEGQQEEDNFSEEEEKIGYSTMIEIRGKFLRKIKDTYW